MNDLPSLLSLLRANQIHLRLEGESLKASAPSGGLTSEIKAAIQRHRPQLIASLTAAEAASLPPIKPAGSAQISIGQRSLLMRHQANPLKFFYNIPRAIRIRGPLAVGRFCAAIKGMVRRHQVLRTNISQRDGAFVCTLREPSEFSVILHDLTTAARRAAETENLIAEEARRPFCIESDFLIRAAIVILAPEEHVALINVHHLAADCWSLGFAFQSVDAESDLWHPGVFFQEVFGHYRQNTEPESREPLLQFADFAAWQERLLASSPMERQRRFWHARLSPPPAQRLFADLPDEQKYFGMRRPFALPASLSMQIAAAARTHATTPFVFLLTAFKILLMRWKGCHDLLIGTPVANRPLPELGALIGSFGNHVIIRTQLQDQLTFRQALQAVHHRVFEAQSHQEYPIEKLHHELPAEATRVQARLIFQSPQHSTKLADGLEIRPIPVDRGISKYELSLVIVEQSSGYRGWGEFLTGHLNAPLFEELIAAYVDGLHLAIENPTATLAQFPTPTTGIGHSRDATVPA